jgi:hypothetical protein
MPLGEKLWEETSKSVGRRILDCGDKGVHAETSFIGHIKGFGRLAGIDGKIMGTDDYWEKLNGDITNGTACGVLRLQNEYIPFKACGLAKLVKRSPLGIETILSLLWVIDPPQEFSWMRNTLILWEAVTDPDSQTVKATAYEWEAIRGEK